MWVVKGHDWWVEGHPGTFKQGLAVSLDLINSCNRVNDQNQDPTEVRLVSGMFTQCAGMCTMWVFRSWKTRRSNNASVGIDGGCQGSFYLGSYLPSWSPISWSELISASWSRCLIPIPITPGSFRDVHTSSYIVHLMQKALISLISEDNHCIR